MGTQGEVTKKKARRKSSTRRQGRKTASSSEGSVEKHSEHAVPGEAEAVIGVGDSATNSKCEHVEPEKQRRAVRVKRECKQQVLNEMDGIVAGLIKKAKGGNSSQAKLLFDKFGIDFASVKKARAAKQKTSGRAKAADGSLAELLLKRLDGDEQPPADSSGGRRPARADDKNNSDAGDKVEQPKARSKAAAAGLSG